MDKSGIIPTVVGADLRARVVRRSVACNCEEPGCVNLVFHVLVDTREEQRQRASPALQIAADVAEAFGLDLVQLRGPSRERMVTQARFVCWLLMRKHLGLSYGQIGIAFDKDHSTILHGCGRAGDVLLAYPEQRELLEQIYGRINPRGRNE